MSGTISGSYSSGVTLTLNPTTITSSATITETANSTSAVYGPPSGTAWDLTNEGQISETGTGGTGVSFASAGAVTNSGTVFGAANGILLGAGGSLTNQSGGTISGYFGVVAATGPATVVNAGLIAGSLDPGAGAADGVLILAGGEVTNQSGGTISGYNDGVRISGAPGTVFNLGHIDSAPFAFGVDGVFMDQGGTVANGQSGGTVSSAYIGGYFNGIDLGTTNAGAVTNYGTISGLPGNVGVHMAFGTVDNGPSGTTGALIVGGAMGVVIDGAGSVVNHGSILGGESGSGSYYGVKLGGAGSVSNLGTASRILAQVGVYAVLNDTVTNTGTIESRDGAAGVALKFGGGTNRLIVDTDAVFIGAVSAAGTTTLQLSSTSSVGTLSGFGTTLTNFTSIEFDAGARWKIAGNSSAAGLGTLGFYGFAAGDTIDLTGFAAVSATFASDALVLTDAVNAHATLHVQGSFVSSEFLLADDLSSGTEIIICFAEGTHIATPLGAERIEDLKIGDRVRTHFAGLAPIQWIGRRHVDCTRHPDPRAAWPVRVATDSFGPGCPDRNLFLSPNHAVYVLGNLIPIKCLINGTSIVQVQVAAIDYYHIELAQHDMLWAEGLRAESYLDAGDRANFANGGEPMRLFPDFAAHRADAAALWETNGCAPLVVSGPRLAAAQRWVNELAGVGDRRTLAA